MGEANFILGVKIHMDLSNKLLSLSQEVYIKKILERFNMSSCNPIDTLIGEGESLSLAMCPQTSKERETMLRVPYSSAVGSLMFAMMCTRPDICYAIGLVSRYQSNLRSGNWKAIKIIMRYLKGTANQHLVMYYCLIMAQYLRVARNKPV